jgi:hypothetical protein
MLFGKVGSTFSRGGLGTSSAGHLEYKSVSYFDTLGAIGAKTRLELANSGYHVIHIANPMYDWAGTAIG